MQIPLNHFEQYIDETILKRGLSYYKKGKVTEVEEISPGLFESIIEGTENYSVKLKIANGTITELLCTCPYDLGPVCKHELAVIFHLQKDELKIEKSQRRKRKDTSEKKKKSITEQADELLEKLSHDELKSFIKENISDNRELSRLFLSSFAHLNENETKSAYNQQIKSILRSVKRNGFIDWSAVGFVGNSVYKVLTTAEKHVEHKNYKSAIYICCAVLEEMTEALRFADDSNGDIGSNIDQALSILKDISTKGLPETERKYLLDYCITQYKNNKFSGWDWHLGMLRLGALLIKEEDESNVLIELLDKPKGSDYEEEYAQKMKYDVLKAIKGEKESEIFAENNITNPELRKVVIDKAISVKDFDKANKIANDGIRLNEKEKPGLIYLWYEKLLEIAIAQNDKEKIIEYARILFKDSHKAEKEEYYNLMKSNVEKSEWSNFADKLAEDIKKRKSWLEVHLIAKIYISEEWWDKLLQLLREDLSIYSLKEYEKYLVKDYPMELADLYAGFIEKELKEKADRKHYQNACRNMRRMLKLGAREKVEQMVETYRKIYSTRRALMEELEKI